MRNNTAVGVAHLFDYLEAMRAGRMDGSAEPAVERTARSVIVADAQSGTAQVAFAAAFDDLVTATRATGLGMLTMRSSYTVGELGYYVRQLADAGLIAVAGANSPALMSFAGSSGPVLGTNPLAYACPRPGRRPIVVDQASSQTAYVNIRQAAENGEPIPSGWAVDAGGVPTTDASAALGGALLPFGGYKGGNIALLVELLAVMSGAQWSLDAPAFDHGTASPGVGMFVIAIDPSGFAEPLPQRLEAHFIRLGTELGLDMSVFEDIDPDSATCPLDEQLYQRLHAAANSTPPTGRHQGPHRA
ncbi:MAG: (2R)-3-sulfolactate dehydrogenase [Nocardioidaceae bacterium]|jgi:(2R)-3-sulfolactate dehydrogenase (NADP+)|nr:(2R)-3-sulfolactate dehydrogenase [Nocardioidaceae bacterium]